MVNHKIRTCFIAFRFWRRPSGKTEQNKTKPNKTNTPHMPARSIRFGRIFDHYATNANAEAISISFCLLHGYGFFFYTLMKRRDQYVLIDRLRLSHHKSIGSEYAILFRHSLRLCRNWSNWKVCLWQKVPVRTEWLLALLWFCSRFFPWFGIILFAVQSPQTK